MHRYTHTVCFADTVDLGQAVIIDFGEQCEGPNPRLSEADLAHFHPNAIPSSDLEIYRYFD